MPLVKCTKDGKSGWKWGENNKSCFTGPDGKKRAIKQGIAIEGVKRFSEEMSKSNEFDENDIQNLIADAEISDEDITIIMSAMHYNLIEITHAIAHRT